MRDPMVASNSCHATDVCAGARPLVLVVEPSQGARSILRLALAQVDCEIIEAATNHGALHVILGQDIDLVVTTLDACSGSGFDLLAALRRLPVERQRPEVVVWQARAGSGATLPHDVAIALPRRASTARLGAAVQAVLDDPLQFVLQTGTR